MPCCAELDAQDPREDAIKHIEYTIEQAIEQAQQGLGSKQNSSALVALANGSFREFLAAQLAPPPEDPDPAQINDLPGENMTAVVFALQQCSRRIQACERRTLAANQGSLVEQIHLAYRMAVDGPKIRSFLWRFLPWPDFTPDDLIGGKATGIHPSVFKIAGFDVPDLRRTYACILFLVATRLGLYRSRKGGPAELETLSEKQLKVERKLFLLWLWRIMWLDEAKRKGGDHWLLAGAFLNPFTPLTIMPTDASFSSQFRQYDGVLKRLVASSIGTAVFGQMVQDIVGRGDGDAPHLPVGALLALLPNASPIASGLPASGDSEVGADPEDDEDDVDDNEEDAEGADGDDSAPEGGASNLEDDADGDVDMGGESAKGSGSPQGASENAVQAKVYGTRIALMEESAKAWKQLGIKLKTPFSGPVPPPIGAPADKYFLPHRIEDALLYKARCDAQLAQRGGTCDDPVTTTKWARDILQEKIHSDRFSTKYFQHQRNQELLAKAAVRDPHLLANVLLRLQTAGSGPRHMEFLQWLDYYDQTTPFPLAEYSEYLTNDAEKHQKQKKGGKRAPTYLSCSFNMSGGEFVWKFDQHKANFEAGIEIWKKVDGIAQSQGRRPTFRELFDEAMAHTASKVKGASTAGTHLYNYGKLMVAIAVVWMVLLGAVDDMVDDDVRILMEDPKLGMRKAMEHLGIIKPKDSVDTMVAKFGKIHDFLNNELTVAEKERVRFGRHYVENLLCKFWHRRNDYGTS
ncbi:hypothetical protein DFJ74DRAFT_712278 [Hyaloraphidium curvatum]|nr:hypothetical protein DFJ74DRAFT_712278 [Hyaloraphidium curvatum]